MFTSRYNWLDKDGFENSELILLSSDPSYNATVSPPQLAWRFVGALA